jgi:transcription elongation factor Elf1
VAGKIGGMSLPLRIPRNSERAEQGRRSPAHRAWVRGFACCACGSTTAVECAHVRVGTDGGMGMKPSDRWCISLCKDCHARQHAMGERTFADAYQLDLKKLAGEFFAASPHRRKLEAPHAR